MYVIECMVQGGRLGTRVALLRRRDKVQYFLTREKAEQWAEELRILNNHPFAEARFWYTVREVGCGIEPRK